MKVLVIGSGGREHALAWKLSQSKSCTKIYVAPGNAGTAEEPKTENVDLKAEDIEGLLSFAKSQEIDLTIVGPEAPLVLGLIDLFEENNLLCLGPNKLAAQMEGSKIFMKDILEKGTHSSCIRSFVIVISLLMILRASQRYNIFSIT